MGNRPGRFRLDCGSPDPEEQGVKEKNPTPRIPRPESFGPLERRPTAGLRPHPQQTIVPQLSEDAYLAFRADIGEHGIQVPLEVTG